MKEGTYMAKAKIHYMAAAAVSAVIITLCSWISVPFTVPFTMQTFAIFCVLGVLGGKWGTVSILVYVLLGAVGLPVFSGFRGGVFALMGPTGGYILGFLFSGLIYWFMTERSGEKMMIPAMAAGLLVCYLFGTVWFSVVYTGGVGFFEALGICVLPFIVPDILKIALAVFVAKKLSKIVRL